MELKTLLSANPSDRPGRYPKHTWQTAQEPFSINPFMIAPVLPGETLQSLFFESRVVTDPIKSPLIGWKHSYFYFYVRISDLLVDAMKAMFVDATNTDISATLGIANNDLQWYTAKGGVDFAKRAYQKITEHFFRDEGEAWNNKVDAAGYAFAQIREQTFLDSITLNASMPTGGNPSTTTDMQTLEQLMVAFESLRALNLSKMDFNDFLKSYGISIPDKDDDKPELLCQFSDFTYPSNTVDPTSGVPTSACSWVFKNGNRDPKFFKEPGFIIGVSVTRPKVYFGGLAGNMSAHMTRAWDWVPNYLKEFPETRYKKFAAGTGPLGDRLNDVGVYWLDMTDLLTKGDQWQNVVPFPANTANPVDTGVSNMAALPDAALNWKYPTEAFVASLFKSGSLKWVRQDGYTSLGIKSSASSPIRDLSVGHIAEA